MSRQFIHLQSTSHVTRHTSHVIRHTSHVTRHTSHVTRHTPPRLHLKPKCKKSILSIYIYIYTYIYIYIHIYIYIYIYIYIHIYIYIVAPEAKVQEVYIERVEVVAQLCNGWWVG